MATEVNGKNKIKLDPQQVLDAYREKFNVGYPPIPMMQCSGRDDPQYIKMLWYAIRKGRPVTEEDEERFFPTLDDAIF